MTEGGGPHKQTEMHSRSRNADDFEGLHTCGNIDCLTLSPAGPNGLRRELCPHRRFQALMVSLAQNQKLCQIGIFKAERGSPTIRG
jgi:hypothetical protein